MSKFDFYKTLEWRDFKDGDKLQVGMVVELKPLFEGSKSPVEIVIIGDYSLSYDLNRVVDVGCGCCSDSYFVSKYAWLNRELETKIKP